MSSEQFERQTLAVAFVFFNGKKPPRLIGKIIFQEENSSCVLLSIRYDILDEEQRWKRRKCRCSGTTNPRHSTHQTILVQSEKNILVIH